MSEYDRNVRLAQYCADVARLAEDERIRRFHQIASDIFLARAVKIALASAEEKEAGNDVL